jgi:RND family efflux transporter MFP subunit
MIAAYRKLALAGGTALGLAFGAAALAQPQDPAERTLAPSASADGVVVSGRLDWMVVSDLSARVEGILDVIEFSAGARVDQGQLIGKLDDTIARLSLEKQKRVVKLNDSAEAKAKAQRDQAVSKLARAKRLSVISPGSVSQEELDEKTADVNYADAIRQEARDKREADQAEQAIAEANLEFHRIMAPFPAVVIERLKSPGEAVRANEAVIRLGKTDTFQFVGWMPLENVERVRVGDRVLFRPTVKGGTLPLERKVFEGRLTAVGPEVSATGEDEIRIYAEVVNPPDPQHPELELYKGVEGELTIQPGVAGVGAAAPAAPAAPAAAPAARAPRAAATR